MRFLSASRWARYPICCVNPRLLYQHHSEEIPTTKGLVPRVDLETILSGCLEDIYPTRLQKRTDPYLLGVFGLDLSLLFPGRSACSCCDGLVTRIQQQVSSCCVLPSNSFGDLKPTAREKNADFYYTQGILARSRRDNDGALTLLKKAVEIDPKYSEAWVEIGGIYFEKRMYDDQLDAFRKVSLRTPILYTLNEDGHFLGAAVAFFFTLSL